MNDLKSYQRALDTFDSVLAAVGPAQWAAQSMCAQWSVRDVAGHVVWGQEQLRHWALGTEYGNVDGVPGAPHPGVLAGDDPLATWRDARERCEPTLTQQALERMVTVGSLNELPLGRMITILTADLLVHAWDIGHALGMDVRIDEDLVREVSAWAHGMPLTRDPAFFAEALTPPDGADEQTTLLAYLGRAAWQPVPA